jgi:hypothetical protein
MLKRLIAIRQSLCGNVHFFGAAFIVSHITFSHNRIRMRILLHIIIDTLMFSVYCLGRHESTTTTQWQIAASAPGETPDSQESV